MAVDAGLGAIALLVGRILFGGVLAFQGLNHFLNLDEMAGYAEFKGIPAPRAGVVISGLVLLLGGPRGPAARRDGPVPQERGVAGRVAALSRSGHRTVGVRGRPGSLKRETHCPRGSRPGHAQPQ